MDETTTTEPGELTFSQEATAPVTPVEPSAPVIRRGKLDRFGVAMGTGRRKTAVARVRLKAGNGDFVVNGRPFTEFFCIERDQILVQAPLKAADKLGQLDIWVRVNGGGTTGQAGAIVLGIARALEAINPNLHAALAEGGYLTRDSRMVERKKYGHKKSRRSFQFSKR
jgi:small subunit ribosomal protein S9